MEILKGWEEFSYVKGSDTGVLLSQGFTGSTTSVSYLGQKLADAGFDVEAPRLTGHGTKWQDLNVVSYKDWLMDIEREMEKLKKRCKNIFAGGLSMGGALALYLAAVHPEIKGVIAINNAIFLGSPLEPFIPVLKYILKSVPAISNDIKDPNEKETAYDRTPVGGVHQLSRVLKLTRKMLPSVTQPILIFKSREDHVLPVRNAEYTYGKVGSKEKELVWLENSYHVATQDNDKDLIVQKSIEFINKYRNG